ncbi:MAG: hypothetical protein K2N64_07640 [Anaeroplasmataceae bacterium]|nr:hypothetical protein [Anaeroplasmataceae bacterium]
MGKTNFEKLKELKEYEAAQVINMLQIHIAEVQLVRKADSNLDAVDLVEDEIEIITSWLKDPYDEKKGFKMYLSGRTEYITSENLEHYNYLEETNNDYSKHFEKE